MIAWIDNGSLLGWYCILDDGYYGEGTKELAEEIAKEMGEH